jgi:hypothetical protein
MGMGVGVGMGMGNLMGQQMGAAMTPPPPAAPPARSIKEELTELKDLFDSQLINQSEYDAQRTAIMRRHGMSV